jgi:hypothetical protein
MPNTPSTQPTDPPRASAFNPPSDKQLRYLRTLCARTGTTFEYPATSAAASRQINLLLKLPTTATMPLERDIARRELRDIRADLAGGYETADPGPLPRDIDTDHHPVRRNGKIAERRGITPWASSTV